MAGREGEGGMNFPSRGQNLAERRSFGYLFCVKYERLPKWAQSLTKLCFKYLTHFSNILKFTPSLNPYPLPEKSLNCTMKTRLTWRRSTTIRTLAGYLCKERKLYLLY